MLNIPSVGGTTHSECTNRLRARGLSVYSIVVFALLSQLFLADPSLGSWKKVAQFAAPVARVNSMYFFDDSVGIIGFSQGGLGCPLMRTTDGGVTWVAPNTPALTFGSTCVVTDIWFKDKLEGWATFEMSQASGSSLWHTLDGGLNWSNLGLTGGTGLGLTSVRATPRALIVTNRGAAPGIYVSTNGGASFGSTFGQTDNDLDFVDSIHGASSFLRDQFNYTTDGGLTWRPALTSNNLQTETWGIYGAKSKRYFVAADETSGDIYRSPVDFGQTWLTASSFGATYITGGITGYTCALYVQCVMSGLGHGLYRSTDSGSTWSPIGGPNNGYDTRFSVTPGALYAGDATGGLWKSTDGGDGTLVNLCPPLPQIPETEIQLTASLCDSISVVKYFQNPYFDSLLITSFQIVDSTRKPATSKAFGIDSVLVPQMLKGEQVLGYRLHWCPRRMLDTAGLDSATILVKFTAPAFNWNNSTIIKVYLRAVQPPLLLDVPAAIRLDSVNCEYDTIVTFTNNSCDTVTLTSAALAINKVWSATDSLGMPLLLPIAIPPDSSLPIRLHFHPKSFAVGIDTLKLGTEFFRQPALSKVSLRGILSSAEALASALSLAFDTLSTCTTDDTLIHIGNRGCDTLTITLDTLNTKDWALLDTNGLPIPLPVKIPPDSNWTLLLRFQPHSLGATSGRITLDYRYLGSKITRTITLTGTGASSGSLVYPNSFALGNVSFCESFDTTITFRNATCNDVRLDSLNIPAPFSLLDSTLFPIKLASGKSITVRVRYRPRTNSDAGLAILKAIVNGKQISDTLALRASAVGGKFLPVMLPSARLTVTDGGFRFADRTMCQLPDSGIVRILDPGCDSMSLDSIAYIPMRGNTNSYIVSTSPSLPKVLANDSVHLKMVLTASGPGQFVGNLHLYYRMDGVRHDTTFMIWANVTGGASALALDTSKIMLGTLSACKARDTTIGYTNTGCDSVTVLGWSMASWGAGFDVSGTGQNPPRGLAIGQSDSLHITYDETHTGMLYDTVNVLTDAKPDSVRRIPIQAFVAPLDSVNFVMSQPASLAPNQRFVVTVQPDRTVLQTKGLTSISGEVEYNEDNFEYESLESLPNLSLTTSAPQSIDGESRIPFQLTNPAGIVLDPTLPVLSIHLQSVLGDTTDLTVGVNSMQLNASDPDFARCVLATKGATSTSSLMRDCNTTFLLSTMRNEELLLVTDPSPNPMTASTNFEAHVQLHATAPGTATIELHDAIGRTTLSEVIPFARGEDHDYVFDLSHFSAGAYIYQVRFDSPAGSSRALGSIMLLK
ncbi:MAG: hypothetical protein Q8922_14235 [Bacteroidota bacterium]|nr:hypothetical protein [Bacteroidota bacterium]MDP4233255.1 hypothetical protein [Bacteroidota bacterium]MDP4242125.1 hypothetical protein [Bacteroidota bacterium]MDP4289076.1 hypothetical protein [Bacteroidota bacterium]